MNTDNNTHTHTDDCHYCDIRSGSSKFEQLYVMDNYMVGKIIDRWQDDWNGCEMVMLSATGPISYRCIVRTVLLTEWI